MPIGEEAITLRIPLSVYREALAALEERVVLLHDMAYETPEREHYWRVKALNAMRCFELFRDAGR